MFEDGRIYLERLKDGKFKDNLGNSENLFYNL